jgi:hypothetical protein
VNDAWLRTRRHPWRRRNGPRHRARVSPGTATRCDVRADTEVLEVDRRPLPQQPLVGIGCVLDRTGSVHRMDRARVHRVEEDAPHHALVGVRMVGRDEALVTEEDLDVAPVERTRREPLVALGRGSPPESAIERGALVTTRSAKCVGTSSTTRSSPGMAMTSNLPEVRDSHARCSIDGSRDGVRLREQHGRVDRAAPAPGPRQPDRLRGADTTRDARRPRFGSRLAQWAPRRPGRRPRRRVRDGRAGAGVRARRAPDPS